MHNNRHANYTHIHMNAPTHARTCTHMHNNNGQSWCSPRRAKNVLHVSHRTDSHWRIATSKPFCASHIFIALIPRTNIRILLLMVFAISLRSFSIWNDGVLRASLAALWEVMTLHLPEKHCPAASSWIWFASVVESITVVTWCANLWVHFQRKGLSCSITINFRFIPAWDPIKLQQQPRSKHHVCV